MKNIPKTTMKKICIFLLAAILLLTGGCRKTTPADELSPIRLTVAEYPCMYTEEQADALSARVAQICRRVVRLTHGLQLNDAETKSLQQEIIERRLPVFCAHGVYADELETLCAQVETLLTEWETADQKTTAVPSVSALVKHTYRQALLLLGAERTGGVVYDNLLLWMNDRIARCYERYDKYGYERYLTEAAELEQLQTELTESLGTETFSDACAILLFSGSILLETPSTPIGGFGVTDAEYLLFLQKQADQTSQKSITAAQWQTVLRIAWTVADDLGIASDALTSLQASERNALLTDDFLNALGTQLPSVLNAWQECVSAMTASDIQRLREGNADTRIGTVCEILLRRENTILALSEALAAGLASSTEAEEKVLQRANAWEDYQAFAAATPTVTPTDLLAAMRACAAEPSPKTTEALQNALTGYLHGFVPYATYVFFHSQEAAT